MDLNDKISVILSVYNESLDIVSKSIESIIQQTYKNIEIIIINDNPERCDLKKYLIHVREMHDNVIYVENKKNIGLVNSLNKGLSICTGKYVARMDADDISVTDRLEKQYLYIKKYKLDIIGCNICKIDEHGEKMDEIKFPREHNDILKYIKYGSCLAHPTWLVRKEVYDALGGYRNIDACEDYDFLIRAINQHFILGNLQYLGLYYRINNSGISQTKQAKQLLTMLWIANQYKRKEEYMASDIEMYIKSQDYINDCNLLTRYYVAKKDIKKSIINIFYNFSSIIFNKFFYIELILFYKRKERMILT